MTSKYILPHLRNKIAPEPQPMPVAEKSSNPPTSEKTFARLATSWAKDSDEKKIQEHMFKQELDSLENIRKRYTAPLPQFYNTRNFVEPEDEDLEEDVSTAVQTPDEDAGWIEVRHRKKERRVKTFEEKMNRPPTPEENNGETVWNPDDNDSYWR